MKYDLGDTKPINDGTYQCNYCGFKGIGMHDCKDEILKQQEKNNK